MDERAENISEIGIVVGNEREGLGELGLGIGIVGEGKRAHGDGFAGFLGCGRVALGLEGAEEGTHDILANVYSEVMEGGLKTVVRVCEK